MFNEYSPENNAFDNGYMDDTAIPAQLRFIRPGPSGPPPMPHMPPYGGQGSAPNSAPPLFVPMEPEIAPFALDPGAVFPCRNRFAYIWPRRGQAFWAWITFVGSRSLAGFRWTGRNWFYFAMDLRDIRNIQCF